MYKNFSCQIFSFPLTTFLEVVFCARRGKSHPLQKFFTIKEQDPKTKIPGALYLDVRPGKRELRRDDFVISLPLRQFKLVQCLMANSPTPMTQWQIFYHVWGEGTAGTVDFGADGGPLAAHQCVQQLVAKVKKKLALMEVTVKSERKGYGYNIMEIINDEAECIAGLGNGVATEISGDIVDRSEGLRLGTEEPLHDQ